MDDVTPPGAVPRAGRLRPLGAVLVAGAVAVLGWLALAGRDGGEATAVETARIVSAAEIRSLARAVGHPVYWAGPRAGGRLELTHDSKGRIYIRYLAADAGPGDPRPLFLTVGTYPVTSAQKVLKSAARRSSSRLHRAPGGGVALVGPEAPTSAYLAYPGSDYQVEVYDPSPGRALRLIRADKIRPVG